MKRARTASERGYTLVEVSVAASLMGLLVVVTSIAIGTSITVSHAVDARASENITVTRFTEAFVSNVVLANPLESIASNQVVMQVTRGQICERHTYKAMTDEDGITRQINHDVQEITVGVGGSCANIDQRAWAGVLPTVVDNRRDIGGLAGPAGEPTFSYYTVGGARIDLSDPSASLAHACQVARVAISLPMQRVDGVETVIVKATPRVASMGPSC